MLREKKKNQVKSNFHLKSRDFLYFKYLEVYLDHHSRILMVICEWMKRCCWVNCCFSNTLLDPAPSPRYSPTLDSTHKGGVPKLPTSLLCRAAQTNQQTPLLPVYKCHARGSQWECELNDHRSSLNPGLLKAWSDMCMYIPRGFFPVSLTITRGVVLPSNAI